MSLQSATYPPTAPSVCTITGVSPAVVTLAAHGYLPNQAIMFFTTGTMWTGMAALTVYYVMSAGWAAGSFQFSATPGGVAINTSGSQSGVQSVVGLVNTVGSGQQTMAGSAGFVLPSDQTAVAFSVTVTPTITASAYAAGNVMGGIMTFSNILPANFVGRLSTITLRFKGSVQPGPFDLVLFTASPSNGTYTDKAAPTWNAADMAFVIGDYTLDSPKSPIGTNTIFTLDNIGKAVVGVSTSLYAVLIQGAASVNNPGSTSDMSVVIGVVGFGI